RQRKSWQDPYPGGYVDDMNRMLALSDTDPAVVERLAHMISDLWNRNSAVGVLIDPERWACNNLPQERISLRLACDMIRDIAFFIDPYALAIPYAPNIVTLANQMKTSMDYSTMPVLADALEEAGST